MAVNNRQLLSCTRIVTLTPTAHLPLHILFLARPDGKGLLKIDLVYMRMYEVLICNMRPFPLLFLKLSHQDKPTS